MHNKMTYGEKLQQAKDTQGLDFKAPPQIGRMDKEHTLKYYTNKLRGYWLNEFETDVTASNRAIVDYLLNDKGRLEMVSELIMRAYTQEITVVGGEA